MSCRVGRVDRVKHATTPRAIALTFTRSLAFSLAHEMNTCLARRVSVRGAGAQFDGKALQNARDAVQCKSLRQRIHPPPIKTSGIRCKAS